MHNTHLQLSPNTPPIAHSFPHQPPTLPTTTLSPPSPNSHFHFHIPQTLTARRTYHDLIASLQPAQPGVVDGLLRHRHRVFPSTPTIHHSTAKSNPERSRSSLRRQRPLAEQMCNVRLLHVVSEHNFCVSHLYFEHSPRPSQRFHSLTRTQHTDTLTLL